MLYSYLLLVVTVSVTAVTFLSHTYMTNSISFFVQTQQQAFAQGNGVSEELEDDPGSSSVAPTEEGTSIAGESDGVQCTGDFAFDPTTGECDSTLGPCPEGETRGESGFCAMMPKECPPGTYIDEDPLCEPCPTEGQMNGPEECNQLAEKKPPKPPLGAVPQPNETTTS
jgi:hypothetical protein